MEREGLLSRLTIYNFVKIVYRIQCDYMVGFFFCLAGMLASYYLPQGLLVIIPYVYLHTIMESAIWPQ